MRQARRPHCAWCPVAKSLGLKINFKGEVPRGSKVDRCPTL